MNMTIRLYSMLTAVSRWIEDLRIVCLIRAYEITSDEKVPTPWREREGLPSADQWPTVRLARVGPCQEERIPRRVLLTGKVKVGPVRPVPTKLESNLDSKINEGGL
jgi:hypothetical protein